MQNLQALMAVVLWFLVNLIYFYYVTNSFIESVLILLYFKSHDSLYGHFYDAFTEFIIFGLLFGLITIELFRKYNPEVTSREISKKYSDHVVIIGYTHIGERIANYLTEHRVEHVIIEEDRNLVDDLITQEKPIINDSPLSIQTLEDAGIQKAKTVYITSGNFEVQMVVNHNVRKLNPECKIVARIFQDDIGELISKTYNVEIISTSKYASEVILEKVKHKYNNVLIIGLNHISMRLMAEFDKLPDIKYNLIEEDYECIKDFTDDESMIIIGDPKELANLQKVNIDKIECVINTISEVKESILITKRVRELNRKCKIISRFFLDSIANILEKEPFEAEVISSSKDTLNIMIQKGLLEF
jgi:Trk K+ transport system NAD-binding subunit